MELGTVHQVFFKRGDYRNRNWDSGHKSYKDALNRAEELESVFLQLNSKDAIVWIESTEKDQGV